MAPAAEFFGGGGVAAAAEEIMMESGVRMMLSAREGDLETMKEMLESGIDVNFRDIDRRTALHVAVCQGLREVVEFLVKSGAEIDCEDRWGSTPFADAIYYKNHDVVKLLESYGAKHPIAPMHVKNARQVPEYDINASELDFTNSIHITKGTFCIASWRGTEVAVKTLDDDVIMDEDKVKAFRDELALLQKIRHPNVVQFLGAVTQSSPMMIVTEYLPKGDLRELLTRKGALKPSIAVQLALDIARGMNYLHEHKPEAIIHRDLEPSNILRDDTGHLKVADFGLSKILKYTKTVKEDRPVTLEETASIPAESVPKTYCRNERPPFNAPLKNFAHGLKELIEHCWSGKPSARPSFRYIINRLEEIDDYLGQKRKWKRGPLTCFQSLESIWKRRTSSTSSHSSASFIR